MSLEIRPSTPADLDRMEQIYAHARAFMAQTGNPTQWITYPARTLLERDIAVGQSYIVESAGTIVGTFVMLTEPDPTYRIIDNGAWLNDEPYATIHRIASDGTCHGVLDAAVQFALNHERNVRIDTHSNNTVMQAALGKLGFIRCGIIYVQDDTGDHEPRIAFQKVAF